MTTAKTVPTFPDLQAEADQLPPLIDDARAAGDTSRWLQLSHRLEVAMPAEMADARQQWLAEQVAQAWKAVDAAAETVAKARDASDAARDASRAAHQALRDAMFARDATSDDRIDARAASDRARIKSAQLSGVHAAAVRGHAEALAEVGRLEDDDAPVLRPQRWMTATVHATNPIDPGSHTSLLRGTVCPRWAEAVIGAHLLVDEADAPPVPDPPQFRQTMKATIGAIPHWNGLSATEASNANNATAKAETFDDQPRSLPSLSKENPRCPPQKT